VNAEPVKRAVEGFLEQHFRTGEMGRDDDIFARGLVTSLFAVQLVEFVEVEFGVHIDSEDLELDNFRSVNAIARFVERKTGPRPQEVAYEA
jgi:acyl carrier protein